MAISINHATRVITVPQADLTFVSAGLYELNVDTFRQWLKDYEDDVDGMTLSDTHRHNTEVTLGGVVLARTVEIINGFTVTFEDGQYAVRLAGANNNIADVMNVNQVSLRSNNSAGLVNVRILANPDNLLTTDASGRVTVGSNADKTGYTTSVNQDKTGYELASDERSAIATALLDLADGIETSYTLRKTLRAMAAVLCGKVSGAPGEPIFRDIADGKARVIAVADASGNRTSITIDVD